MGAVPRPAVGAAGWSLSTAGGSLGRAGGAACGPMSVGRSQVFIGKVLKRLFAATPSTSHVPVPSGEEMVLKNPTSKPQQKDSENAQASSKCASSPGRENEILLPRLYTVSLPLDGYDPGNPRTESPTNAEHSESNDDAAVEDSCGQPKRKRIRRTKQKNSVGNPDNLHGEQTESGKHETLFQDNLQLPQTDGRKISKNKKRKMKKKRQKEKMRAAGLLTKTTGMDFTYQPEKDNSEGADFKDIYEKADGILDFLQATQEIYFADNKSKCTDSAMSSATVQEILHHLESHSLASSDVTLLHKMKSLVLLQDIERLKVILEQFQEHSMMLPDHAKIISSLFHYWITDILPGKNRK
ncbi:glutamate-rich protein 1 isoform X3 [Dermochelys coriacea]|uniref:glutamate-rich protein 1 isoform X3 n=1 Tax=Dermochelys coriacea TaxID=27794 RepID=UPI0018E837F8|nr:glutamate-rich protein 1 isoform X3 [Dermochelys coriacea]